MFPRNEMRLCNDSIIVCRHVNVAANQFMPGNLTPTLVIWRTCD